MESHCHLDVCQSGNPSLPAAKHVLPHQESSLARPLSLCPVLGIGGHAAQQVPGNQPIKPTSAFSSLPGLQCLSSLSSVGKMLGLKTLTLSCFQVGEPSLVKRISEEQG